MGVTPSVDITTAQRKIILDLLKTHLPNTEVWVYGSRAKWTSRPQSDLDMAVFTTPEQKKQVSNLKEAFEESDLPFRVDLFVWDEVPEKFRKNIEANHVVFRENVRHDLEAGHFTREKLESLCLKIGSGATPRGGNKVYLSSGEIALIRSQNVRNDRFSHVGLVFIEKKHADQLSNVSVEENDVLLNITGDSVARCCQVDSETLPARVNQHVAIIRPDKRKLDPQFLRYFLISPEMQNQMLGWAGSGGTRNALTKGMIEDFKVPIPYVSEQRAIAHILGTLDDKIELNRKMNETLEAMAQALFKSWFVNFDPVIDNALSAGKPIPDELKKQASIRENLGDARKPLPQEIQKLFPDEFEHTEKLGWIPKGWEVSTIGNEFNVTMGQSPPGSSYNEEKKGEPFFQGKTDFGFRYPSNRVYCTQPKRFAFQNDSLVSVRAPVGDVNMAIEKCCIGRGIGAVRHKSRSRSYTYYAMKQLEEHFNQFEAEGTVFGSINQTDFKNLKWVKFSKNLVETFEKWAGVFDQKIEMCSMEIRTLTLERDTLLPKLLSGELRIPEVEKFVEAI